MTAAQDWNNQIIAEFRANKGKVGGPFRAGPAAPAPMGQDRPGPGEPGGVPRTSGTASRCSRRRGAHDQTEPYYNILANPRVSAEIGTQTLPFVARVAEGAERDRIWAAQKIANPGFADYERKTTRQIPVVILEPVG